MILKIIKSGDKINVLNFKNQQVFEFDYSQKYEMLFKDKNVIHVKGKMDRHGGFKIKGLVQKNW